MQEGGVSFPPSTSCALFYLGSAHFCFSCHTQASYVLILLTCKVTFLFMSSGHMPHKGPLMRNGFQSLWSCMVNRSKVVALMHWNDIKANLCINIQVGYLWKVMMIIAVPLINGEKDCNEQPSVHYISSDKLTQHGPLKVHLSGSRN